MKVIEPISLNLDCFNFNEFYFVTWDYFPNQIKDSFALPTFLKKRQNLAKTLESMCLDSNKNSVCIYSNGRICEKFLNKLNEHFKQADIAKCRLYYIEDYEQFKLKHSEYLEKASQFSNVTCTMYACHENDFRSEDYYPSKIIENANGHGNLWLGSVNYTTKKFLIDNKITHLLNVTKDEIFICENSTIKRIPIHDCISEDILQHFDDAFEFVHKALMNGNCLVYCQAGISRSPTIVCAYLMKTFGWTNKQALKFVQEKRKIVCPNIRFLAALENYSMKVEKEFQEKNISNQNNDNITPTTTTSGGMVSYPLYSYNTMLPVLVLSCVVSCISMLTLYD